MVHHTASGPSSDGWPDVNYCTYGSADKPLANLYLSRDGTTYVMAAGATNTNGKGGPLDGVPADSMNTHAVGIEAGNNGTGEPWPEAQQNAYLVMVAALQQAYAMPYARAHWEWAPGRKVDPAGPSRWASSGSWNMDAFRADVESDGGSPVPPAPMEGSRMLIIFFVTDAAVPYAAYVTNGMAYRHLVDNDDLATLQKFMELAGLSSQPQNCTKAQVGFAGSYVDENGAPGAVNPYL
jgi:hypothetical protein